MATRTVMFFTAQRSVRVMYLDLVASAARAYSKTCWSVATDLSLPLYPRRGSLGTSPKKKKTRTRSIIRMYHAQVRKPRPQKWVHGKGRSIAHMRVPTPPPTEWVKDAKRSHSAVKK